MKSLILRHREWERIFAQVRQDYAATPAVYLFRTRMQRDLGWTYREHTDRKKYSEDYEDIVDWRDTDSRIHIDFYSEQARTFFLLRYMGNDEN